MIIGLLGQCFLVQKTFGKQNKDAENVMKVFLRKFKKFPPEDVINAIDQWLEDGYEFPTIADIKAILQPKPKLERAVYVRFLEKKRNGDMLSPSEQQYIKNFERAAVLGDV